MEELQIKLHNTYILLNYSQDLTIQQLFCTLHLEVYFSTVQMEIVDLLPLFQLQEGNKGEKNCKISQTWRTMKIWPYLSFVPGNRYHLQKHA